MKPKTDMHRTLAATPLACFIPLRTYGTKRHGDQRGTADKIHTIYGTAMLAADPASEVASARRMNEAPFLLAADSAALVGQTVRERAAFMAGAGSPSLSPRARLPSAGGTT
jgi:hypothetical protein